MREQDIFKRLINDFEQVLTPRKNSIPVDIKKTTNGLEFYVFVPGIKRDDISVDIDESRHLNISISSSVEDNDKEQWIYMESLAYFQRGERKFELSPEIDTASISASLSDGILVISFLNKEKVSPKKVDIQIK